MACISKTASGKQPLKLLSPQRSIPGAALPYGGRAQKRDVIFSTAFIAGRDGPWRATNFRDDLSKLGNCVCRNPKPTEVPGTTSTKRNDRHQ